MKLLTYLDGLAIWWLTRRHPTFWQWVERWLDEGMKQIRLEASGMGLQRIMEREARDGE